jgi:hypothetical protein
MREATMHTWGSDPQLLLGRPLQRPATTSGRSEHAVPQRSSDLQWMVRSSYVEEGPH